MTATDDIKYKSLFLSRIVRQREDVELRDLIDGFKPELEFHPIEHLMVSESAWRYIAAERIEPKLVFAHPNVLQSHPKTSQYYRGIALLSQKRVGKEVGSVAKWEDGSLKRKPTEARCLKVACLYNTVISSIIENSVDWTLENGYRNILLSIGIRLDGSFRNVIGDFAEKLIKSQIADWLNENGLIQSRVENVYELPEGYVMTYGSEPDIRFDKDSQMVATIEIKGGTDAAGALERLGAMRKSFENTPPGCVNMLVAGIVTDEMQKRLDEIGTVKVYLLEDLAENGPGWETFIRELFHYTIRIT